MLGPSGSGKTTSLRLIAGFETPDSGAVALFGKDVARLPPYERDVNTVFQDYALFPHLTVLENIGYGLLVKGVGKTERRKRALAMLEVVRLSGVEDRKPAALSGGQRQRVALARALVNEPKVLLLDEPLGALDLKLREEMQSELKALQKRLGLTFVYVTHDQGEALSMSDRVAVFSKGKLEQVAAPRELYRAPKTRFVADFVGVANIVDGAVLRPESIAIAESGDGVTGRVLDVQFQGPLTRFEVATERFGKLVVVAPSRDRLPAAGATVQLSWHADAAVPLGDGA